MDKEVRELLARANECRSSIQKLVAEIQCTIQQSKEEMAAFSESSTNATMADTTG